MRHPDTKPVNFIVAKLGDNDFLHGIQSALKDGITKYGYHITLCPILWKRYIVNYVIGQALRDERYFGDADWKIHEVVEWYYKYLSNGITVTFEEKRPECIIGEDCYIDVHTKEIGYI